MAKKSQREIQRSLVRLASDGKAALVPIVELTDVTHASPSVVIRWIVCGRHGVFLDGLKRRGEWYSTAAAVERFLAQDAADVGRKGGVV